MIYDYVIVGAGSAGCVLAARLSEEHACEVLVLEAGGGDRSAKIRIPAAWIALLKSRYDWDYSTVAQHHAGEREIYLPRGRTLGGSSAINAMIYIRGNRADYDIWRDRYGCTGWGYADVLPYFRRAENQQRGESEFHGTGGPLHVEDPRYQHPVSQAWIEAACATGLPANRDFNGAMQYGAGYYQLNQYRGRRWTAADAYLHPATRRPNLTVQTGALVTQVLVERGTAVGVRYRLRGRERHAWVRREVILCGGVVNTPQLLMLSGIGPAEHLRQHGIDVVLDSQEVGAGLQDHPLCAPMWSTPRTRNIWEEATPPNMLRWLLLRRGPLVSNGAEAGGFIRTQSGVGAPDVQFHVVPAPYVDQGLETPKMRAVAVLTAVVDVRSRGRVRLRSADPAQPPDIDPGYLSEPDDVETMVAGIRQACDIAAAHPLADLIEGELAPRTVAGDADLRAWIRTNVSTMHHPTSSCAMGSAATAVCDPDLRVRGMNGLRIADASVMPTVPRGNTNAATIAIAERASDLIRGKTPMTAAKSVKWMAR
jgi:choline dehydrogenase